VLPSSSTHKAASPLIQREGVDHTPPVARAAGCGAQVQQALGLMRPSAAPPCQFRAEVFSRFAHCKRKSLCGMGTTQAGWGLRTQTRTGIQTHTHTYTHIHTRTHTHTHIHTHTLAHAHTHAHARARAQEFVWHECDTSELGSTRFSVTDVHHIGILDIRLFNTDRHAGNMLVRAHACVRACCVCLRIRVCVCSVCVGAIVGVSGGVCGVSVYMCMCVCGGACTCPCASDPGLQTKHALNTGAHAARVVHRPLKSRIAAPQLDLAVTSDLQCITTCARHTTQVRMPRASSTDLKSRIAAPQYELIPIDHGFCLPETLEAPYFEWLHWPQAMLPFSEEELAYIRALDIEVGWEGRPALFLFF